MTIVLTTIGSRGVTVDIRPSALPEAPAASRSSTDFTMAR